MKSNRFFAMIVTKKEYTVRRKTRLAKSVGALAALCLPALLFAENLDTLLGAYAQKADLSIQTKQESAGFLQIYTRQDLERMQIRQLKELIERLPFLRYGEDRLGLTHPLYVPYQPPVPDLLQVYINDRAVSGVITNDGLRVFGQMDLSIVDHVEIYMGIPSQSFGVEGAYYVIKLYTKEPIRENTSLVGALLGSRGTRQLYGYTADGVPDNQYQVFAEYMNLKRQEVQAPTGVNLKRDKEYGNLYGEWRLLNHRFELQAISGRSDAFMGESPQMLSINPSLDFKYIYGGWYYEEKERGVKLFANLTHSVSRYRDKTSPNTPLGFYILPNGGAPVPFYEDRTRVEETFVDMLAKKRFTFGRWQSDWGLQSRYKNFNITDTPYPQNHGYDTQLILSAFTENSYLLDASRIVVGSFKIDRYLQNGAVSDLTLYSGRVGLIYNDGRWVSKTFFMYGEAPAAIITYFTNRYLFLQDDDPKAEKGMVAATQLIYKTATDRYAFFISTNYRKNAQYFTLDDEGRPQYGNLSDTMNFITTMVEYEHWFTPLNRLQLQGWHSYNIFNNDQESTQTFGLSGGFVTTLGRFDLFTDLIYKRFKGVEPGLDWNAAITYHHSRRLTFFIKANNILGRALKQDYFTIDPLTSQRIDLSNVDIWDKRVWAGVEWQF